MFQIMEAGSSPKQSTISRAQALRFPGRRIARVGLFFAGLLIASYVASALFYLCLAGWDSLGRPESISKLADVGEWFAIAPLIAIISFLPALLATSIDWARRRTSPVFFVICGAVLGAILAAATRNITAVVMVAVIGAIAALLFWLIAIYAARRFLHEPEAH
jgi:hypothetical protein